ncbi:cytochrome P450 [Byssothecium circinans]|uniref:Cytochrome P450 n=1 Tax=Byssothecium circinans TaxID=147558 RepID=A0A6A5TRP3_9PLEO|nr:cytochrome P450 [Byssothecium circinans]
MELGRLLEHRALLAAAAGVGFVVYWLGLVVYRLVFHPLAKFPGSKWAAATTWYEAYYEIVKGGQFSKKISELHDQYGPIIRVTPDEIHIRDSHFFDTIYPAGVHLDKVGWDSRFGSENGLLMTVHAAAHKRRRAALAPMFSRRSILDFIHIIHRHIDTFADRLHEFESRKEPINLTNVFPALTGDIIMDYFFGFNQGHLQNPEFESFHEAFKNMGPTGHVATQFPSILPLMEKIPDWLVCKMQPDAKRLLDFRRQNKNLINQTLQGTDLKVNDAPKTVFHEILSSKHLPAADKSQKRLEDEALTIVAGGVETTAYTLTIATYHIAANPAIYTRLHADLVAALPNRSSFDLQTLEQVPYLKACIMEAVRLSYGLSARNPRTHDREIRYGEWVIPRRTCVSMSIPDLSHDEKIFPESRGFVPERWLDGGEKGLEQYMVCFGRGTRSCLGINLAWTELYLVLGMMFRGYKFKLFETDVSDVEMRADYFIPHVRRESKGVRAFVTSTTD